MLKPEEMQVVVLMGGLGTRLKEYTKECPKPLVEVNSRPFFDYQLKLLTHYGFKKFLFLIGYRAEMIEEHYKDGSDYGITIEYCYDGEELLGTGGAIRRAYDYLEDDFLVMYGDSFMDIDYEETIYRYFEGKQHGKRAIMTVLHNNNMFDRSNVIVRDNEIVLYDKSQQLPEMNYIDYGVCAYEKALFEKFEMGSKFDVAQLQNELSLKGELAAHIVSKRFYEIGSPGALSEFREYAAKRFDEPRPAVFVDRDGVLNEIVFNDDIEQLDSPQKPEQFRLLDKAAEAMKLFREKGYYVFVVTNQPGAAKGKSSLKTLYDINTSFVQQMKAGNAEPDSVYMCPHYPRLQPNTKESFLIKKCDCRKPLPGLLFKPKDIYNIDYENSYMIGDSFTDVLAGEAAGVRTIYIGELKCDACKKLCDISPDYIVRNVYEAAEIIEQFGKQ